VTRSRCANDLNWKGTIPAMTEPAVATVRGPCIAVIGFDAVVGVAMRTMAAPGRKMAFSLQFPNRGRIAAQFVSREDVWRAVIRICQGSLKEALGRFAIRLPAAVDRTEQVQPATGDPHKRLVHVPCRSFLLDLPRKRRCTSGP